MRVSLFKSSLTVGSFTMLSRVFGFVRDILTAAFLGAGPAADAFVIALKLPNFFRRISAEGAFSVAFVPAYTKRLEGEGRAAALAYAGKTVSLMLGLMIPFSILVILLMPWVIHGLAPGFEGGDDRYRWAVEIGRVTFPYLMLMSVVALFGGMLNSHNRFAPFAAAPILFNLCLIGSLLLFAESFETPAHAMAGGVLAAGVAQVALLVIAARRAGLRVKLGLPKLDGEMKRLLKLMAPGVLGAGVVQLNIVVDMILASFLPAGAVSFLYYADRLNQLPLGVIGVAIGTVLLPSLTRAFTQSDGAAQSLFNRALVLSSALTLPAAVALISIPDVILTVLFQRGEFDAAATAATSGALRAYALGLPAYVASKVLSSGFYAVQDTKTPVKIAIIAALMNIALGVAFIIPLQHIGIALATAIAAWAQCAMLTRALRGAAGVNISRDAARRLIKLTLAAVTMGALVFTAALIFFNSATSLTSMILTLIALVGLGGLSYGALVFGSKTLGLKDLTS